MTENIKLNLLERFLELPLEHQVTLVGIAFGIAALGFAAGMQYRAYQVLKVEAEKRGLKNEIDRLKHSSPTSNDSSVEDLLEGTPELNAARFDEQSLADVLRELEPLAAKWMEEQNDETQQQRVPSLRMHDDDKPPLVLAKKYAGRRFKWSATLVDFDAIEVRESTYMRAQVRIDKLINTSGFGFGNLWFFDAQRHYDAFLKLNIGDRITATGVLNQKGELVRCELSD